MSGGNGWRNLFPSFRSRLFKETACFLIVKTDSGKQEISSAFIRRFQTDSNGELNAPQFPQVRQSVFRFRVLRFEILHKENAPLPEIRSRGYGCASLPADAVPTPLSALGIGQQKDEIARFSAALESQNDPVESGVLRNF